MFELTYNWDRTEPYDLGDGYAQVAIGSDDVYKTAEAIRENGGTISKEPQELSGIGTKIMATTDPGACARCCAWLCRRMRRWKANRCVHQQRR